jgi:signal transduction histidine kinase
VPAAQIDQVLRGERPRLDAVSFDQEDGMRTIECHGLSQPAGWKHHDGSLWFPTAKGFVRIQPARQRRLPPPAVIPGEVLVNGKPVATNGDAELPAGARNVELRFSALRLSAASKLRFRYRMEGFDPDWVEAAGERSARYSRLSPGRHRFILEAADPGGPWSEPLEIPIAQLPRFYETKWFTLLLALAALSAAAGIYAWRMRLVKGRYAAVLAERNRIAREWHDTLVAGFSAISLQLEATLARLKDHPGKAAEIVEVTRRMVHHYRAEARRVIWDLRDSRPETEQLAEAVSSALQRATEGRPVAGSVEVTGQPVPLARDLEHNVLRICQEAAANALRHGHPEHLRVRLEYAPAHLVARIEDDGAGFDPSALNGIPSGHFGLTVMQERARRFGGQLRIDSAPGRGTAVEATIPIAPRSAS